MKPQTRRAIVFVLLLSLLSIVFVSGNVLASDAEQQAQFTAPKLVANTSFLNVRTGPGIQYSIMITVVGGSELPVLGVASDKVWYQVSTIAGVGWVNIEYCLARGDFSVVPLAEAPESTVLVIDNPSTVASAQTVLPSTTVLPAATGSNEYLWGISILGGDFHVQPDYASDKILEAMGEDLSVIYPMQDFGGHWVKIDLPGTGAGWIDMQFVKIRPLVCSPNQSAVVVKQEAGVQGVNYVVMGGTEAFVIGLRTGQAKIRLSDGATGWIALDATQGRDESKIRNVCPNVTGVPATTVTGTTPVTGVAGTVGATTAGLAAPRVIINTGFLNIRSGPGSQYTVVTTLPGGSEVPVIGMTKDGEWYWVQGAFGRGWLDRDFVLFRGTIENVAIIHTPAGTLATPMAIVSGPVTLYAAPNVSLGVVGAISGPVELPAAARTSDFSWVQLSTSIGFGWVQASQVVLQGDLSLIPIVGG
jgi:uncharacterized protein YraI